MHRNQVQPQETQQDGPQFEQHPEVEMEQAEHIAEPKDAQQENDDTDESGPAVGDPGIGLAPGEVVRLTAGAAGGVFTTTAVAPVVVPALAVVVGAFVGFGLGRMRLGLRIAFVMFITGFGIGGVLDVVGMVSRIVGRHENPKQDIDAEARAAQKRTEDKGQTNQQRVYARVLAESAAYAGEDFVLIASE